MEMNLWRLDKRLNLENYLSSNLFLSIERTNNDNYFKGNKKKDN